MSKQAKAVTQSKVAQAIGAAITVDTQAGTLHAWIKSVMPKGTVKKGMTRAEFVALGRERIGARLAKHMASTDVTDTETLWIKGAVTFTDTGAVLNTRYAKGTKVSGKVLSEKVISMYATIGNVAKEYGLTSGDKTGGFKNKASATAATDLKAVVDKVLSSTTVKEAGQFDALWLERVLLERIGKELAENVKA